MKKIIYPALLFAFMACQSAPESSVSKDQLAMQQTITDLENDLKKKGDVVDRQLAKDLVSRYIKYHNQYHADTLSGEYMLRAASLSTGIGEYQQAIDLLINFYDGYPNSKRRPEAAYTVAFIYDSYLQNPEKAALYYQAVIDNHPDSRYAREAEAALRLVGMSDEQLIEFLQQNNPQ
jgi:outer membrane protein assembly factor BamD (BamD/ComL family)